MQIKETTNTKRCMKSKQCESTDSRVSLSGIVKDESYLSSFIGGRNWPHVLSDTLVVDAGFQMSAIGVLNGLNVLAPLI